MYPRVVSAVARTTSSKAELNRSSKSGELIAFLCLRGISNLSSNCTPRRGQRTQPGTPLLLFIKSGREPVAKCQSTLRGHSWLSLVNTGTTRGSHPLHADEPL